LEVKMTLEKKLDQLTIPGDLFVKESDNAIRCTACVQHCRLVDDRHGVCGVRFNKGGVLYVPHGYAAGVQVDPIEKKPFAHFLPGSQVLTFGMLGCNFRCSFCQNWETSQVLRDKAINTDWVGVREVSAKQMVAYAVQNGAASIASSYNEPFITVEWAAEIFKLAKDASLKTAMVSNGFATPESLAYIRPWLDGLKVDLKSMRDERYHQMGGRLQPVLDTIKGAREAGLWVEVVTLVIPGFNDSNDELWETGRFLMGISPDIPWHVTAYHPDYKMLDAPATPSSTLQRAAEIGQEAGLHYVYAGNLPGKVGSLEDTYCPRCAKALIKRRGYLIQENNIGPDGKCPECGTFIAGIWK
jgi:pyruvate formate lyase activating enzyme